MDLPGGVLKPIPTEFYSGKTGMLHHECIDCNKSLLTTEADYFIEKAVRRYAGYAATETIFEYALCFDCHQKLTGELSKESSQNIENYFLENIDYITRMSGMMPFEDTPAEHWLSHCIVKETPASELLEYQMVGVCKGDQMVFHFTPFILGEKAMDEVAELLSDKTLDFLDDFRENLLDYPPELRDLLKGKPVLML
jgi:hypothetical protein